MMKYMVSVSRKNWGNWPFRHGKMLKKREKIRKFHFKNLATMYFDLNDTKIYFQKENK